MERIRRLFQEGFAVLLALLMPAARSVRENVGLAALSVVLAFGLWIVVTDTENPTRTGVPPVDLTVEPVHVPSDLAVANVLAKVRVRVRVAQDVWDSLTAADFRATVDLEGLQVGVYDLPVEVAAQSSRGGLSVIGAAPGTIEVDLEPLFSKSVPVVLDLRGSPPSGYTIGQPQLSEKTALVTGPQAKVESATQAVASLDLGGRTEPVSQAVRLEPRDQRGFLVEGVSVSPPVADVEIDITQEQYSRNLAVRSTVTGAPAEGYNVVAAKVEPATVTVFGPRSFIQESAVIQTQPVDVTGAKQDVVRTVSLDLPPGVSVSGGVSVTVTVRIEPAEGQLSFLVPVRAVGLGEGLAIAGALPSVQVDLLGPMPTLLELRPGDIAATVDLTGLKAGTQRRPVSVQTPLAGVVATVTPAEIDVTLEER